MKSTLTTLTMTKTGSSPVGVTDSSVPELLRLEAIREILGSPGPCVTILLPPYRPGGLEGSSAVLLRANIQEAARQLGERGVSKTAIASLMQPLRDRAEDPALAAGSHWGRAIFRSPDVFQEFHLTNEVDASLTVGGCFSIRQLAQELSRPSLFYVLALSKTRVALLRCTGLHAEVAKLPAGIPDTLAEALELERPDHDLEGRSAAGTSTGAMHSVRFGTGSGRERQHTHLADYYKLIDRGLQEAFHGPYIPLILAGVEEDVAIYRAGSAYPNLVKGAIFGSLNAAYEAAEILRQAYSILRADEIEREHAELISAKERTAPSRFSTDPDIILGATFQGRVGQIYLNEHAKKIDVCERGTYQSWGKEDLLNLAAVQTLIHRGQVWTLPAEMMPDGSVAAALMRF